MNRRPSSFALHALATLGGLAAALFAGEAGAQTVTLGETYGNRVAVPSGVRAGDRVVVDGSFVLKAEAEKARGLGESDEQ